MHDLPQSQPFELTPPPGKEPSESPPCHNQEKQLVCISTAEDSPTARSLEVLGSSLFAERKLSAFSIFCPGSPRSD